MAVLKAMTSGGARRDLDFYPTPPEATLALLPLIKHWPREVWEPCCGDGAMSKVLEANGFNVLSSDIVDRGFGHVRDFFAVDQVSEVYRTIITNPPFGRADDFIRHAHKIGIERMALILKINFWNARTQRRVTWETWRPYLVAPLTWRLDFTGQKKPHTDCMWCLWDRSAPQIGTNFEPVHKPEALRLTGVSYARELISNEFNRIKQNNHPTEAA